MYKAYDDLTALVFDCETTGLPKHPTAKDSAQPRIIEFCGILINQSYEELEVYETLVNPGQTLEQIITDITGLTDEDLSTASPFSEVQEELRALFKKADILVAHNLPFDSGLVEMELKRNSITDWPWPRFNICTVQETTEHYGYRKKLQDLYRELTGNPWKQTHRATDDVRALIAMCKALGVIDDFSATES